MAISTDEIKKLRDMTGVSIMQCKKALEETGGDHEKALIILRKRGGEVAAKKAGRTLGAGVVEAYVHTTGTVGALVLLSCETDFVAKNDEFKSLARTIAMQVTAMNPMYTRFEDVSDEEKAKAREVFAPEVKDKPKNMHEKILSGKIVSYFADQILLNQPLVKNQEMRVEELLNEAIQKFGERIEVSQFTRFIV